MSEDSDNKIPESPRMTKYFDRISSDVRAMHDLANKAKKLGLDPDDTVNVPIAESMAERVEGLISAVAPQLVGVGMIERIHELEREIGNLDWRVGFKIAEEIAKEKFCKFESKIDAMEVGIRAGFCYLTLGIVSAPLEGFVGLKLKKRRDGKGEYFSLVYAGPIRGAGGTASSVSVILSDYVRVKMGYAPYDPTEQEVNRFVAEINDYHERVTNLQYRPSEDELRFLVKHLPVEISGEPTEKIEVSNYKDLPRMETNKIRGGMCLVLAEGVSQKAAKLWKRLEKWGNEMDLQWDFLGEFLKLQKKIKAGKSSSKGNDKKEEKLTPNYTFIADLVAGRPVVTHPMANGGFRLRYGRGRNSGFSAACIHPLTQQVLDNFVAIGTQFKMERPGKAASLVLNDSIEPPIVKLKDGTIKKLEKDNAKEDIKQVEEIVYLGDILFSYGDFSENGHKLVPAGYVEEWWILHLEKAIKEKFETIDKSDFTSDSKDKIKQLIKNPLTTKPDFQFARYLSTTLNIPLHPQFIFYWKTINKHQLLELVKWLENQDFNEDKLILPFNTKDEKNPFKEAKRALELLAVPHQIVNNEYIMIKKPYHEALLFQIGFQESKKIHEDILRSSSEDVLEIINNLSPVEIKDKCGTFIGSRMGRPEKAKMRKLTGSPHVLFPVGEEGGRLRSFQAALEAGKITAEFQIFECKKCNRETIYKYCEVCNEKTTPVYFCSKCGKTTKEECDQDGRHYAHKYKELDIKHYMKDAKKKTGSTFMPELIKGVRGTSNEKHIPEHLAKGILRSKHGIYVNKDGTTRYDMSELPITHFMPKEIGTSVEKLKELGYDVDIHGKPLENSDQILEIYPQDILVPGTAILEESAKDVLFRVGRFVDDLLVNFYKTEPYYNFKKKDDIVGSYVIGLAPHISAGMIGRIIGFSAAQGCIAHPMWHAGLRRDCDGDECCVMMLMDAFLNFSRQYLPNTRGARTMDAPLVLTIKLLPGEVDDQSHGTDIVWQYPLELYEAAEQYKKPWDVKVRQIKHELDTPQQYEGMGFTHNTSNINSGNVSSAYKTLPSMAEKMEKQMHVACILRAVDENNVAHMIIDKHFLKDIKGNLRKFSMQQFRCVACNEKYRRPPLKGSCIKCNGKIIFTISFGSITKYLEPSLKLSREFDVGPYMEQTLELLQSRVEGVFGREKEKQAGLKDFV